MESQQNCPECQGTMVLVPGGGGLFWQCQKCGNKVPYSSEGLKE